VAVAEPAPEPETEPEPESDADAHTLPADEAAVLAAPGIAVAVA